MNRRRAVVAAVLVSSLALALSACSPSTNVSTTAEPARTVNVSATGMADAVPDAAHASLSVITTDPGSAKTAQETAAVATTKVIDALKAAGVDEADTSTQSINVGPTYSYPTDGGQTLTGYQASQSITVTLRDLSTAGATLDAVVAAGGNAARVDSLTTFVTDPTVAANKARAQAVDIAQAQAEQYAQLLGFTLGPVASVSESTNSNGPMPMAMADSAATAEKVPTPVEAGTTQVSVTLNIAWSIAD
ncbi:MAG: SIMPL domain-containing protein [bacterium]|nr:SIMPL domain-containing protein [bacterium]